MILEFAVKTLRCNKGYPCGGSCISRQRSCKKSLQDKSADFADWLKQSALRTSRKIDINPIQPSHPKRDRQNATDSFASVDRGLSADSKNNKRFNAKLEKELDLLEKEADRRVKQNKDLYSDNQSIIFFTKVAHLYNPEGTRIARSANGEIEAIANFQTKDRSIYIDYLATSPKNVDRNDPQYTRGNGTKMIIEAVKESIEKGKGGAVTLSSLPGAVKFYEKLGFKKTKSNGTDIPPMMLSQKNAKKLLDMALNFQELSIEDELEILELEAKGAFAGAIDARSPN